MILRRSVGVLLFVALTGVSVSAFEVLEPSAEYIKHVSVSPGTPTSFRRAEVPESVIDIRGVGDMAWTHSGGPGNRPGLATSPKLGDALGAMDPNSALLKGDLSFANVESVVSRTCSRIRHSVDFYFLTHVQNIVQAMAHGFNIFSFANNHAQDCAGGPLTTEEQMNRITQERSGVLWNGVGKNPMRARIAEFVTRDGKRLRVAFGALTLVSWPIPNAAVVNFNSRNALNQARPLLRSLEDAQVDLRILSIHTQDSSGNRRPQGPAFRLLKSIGSTFIKNHRGNIVFGHGPHTWGGVKIVPRADGGRGVVFSSMGNFIHQGLSSNSDNYIARALLDRKTFSVSEVQVIPFTNLKTQVAFRSSPGKLVRSNFAWKTIRIPTEVSGRKAPIGAFSGKF